MSIHAIISPIGDLTDSLRWQRAVEIQRLALAHIGREPIIIDDGTTLSLSFTPDLAAGETVTLRRLIATTGLLRITPTEWAAIEDDLASLRIYSDLLAPTGAQTVSAVRSIIRALRVLMRD